MVTIDGLLRRSAFRSLRRISFWSASARRCRLFRAHIGHTSNVMRPVATGGAPTSKSSVVHKRAQNVATSLHFYSTISARHHLHSFIPLFVSFQVRRESGGDGVGGTSDGARLGAAVTALATPRGTPRHCAARQSGALSRPCGESLAMFHTVHWPVCADVVRAHHS